MKNQHPPMTFVGCEVDPAGVYEVELYGDLWTVRRCGVITGALPPRWVEAQGPLSAATTLIGYGVFVSRKTYSLGPAAWADEGFSAIVDREVEAL